MAIEKKKQTDQEAAAGGKGQQEEQPAGIPIAVHSNSGFKRGERPRAFELEGRKLTVLQVKQTWRSESAKGRGYKNFFRVHAHDGRTYDIAQDEGTGEWTLEPTDSR
ncbi:MAG: DUF6504 family protein [Thermoleophilia bacterium]